MKSNFFKILPTVFVMFLMIGSACGSAINYQEVNSTVEQTTIIDEPPVYDNQTQEIVNVKNNTYDEISVKNETIKNVTYNQTTKKIVGWNSTYSFKNGAIDFADVDKIVYKNGTVATFAIKHSSTIYCINTSAYDTEYYDATMYFKNGSTLDICFKQNPIKTMAWYGIRNDSPIYENETVEINNITNKITTLINHITEVIYKIVDKTVPVENVTVNETTTNGTVEYPPANTAIATNNSDMQSDNSVDSESTMHSTGYGICVLILAIIIIAGIVVRKD